MEDTERDQKRKRKEEKITEGGKEIERTHRERSKREKRKEEIKEREHKEKEKREK